MAASSSLTLVGPVELHELLACTAPPLVLDASSGGEPPASTLPSAVVVRLSELDVSLESAPGQPQLVSGNYSLLPPAELKSALQAIGVTHNRRCIVYTQSRKCGIIDAAVAARLAWCLSYAGVEHVSLLAGGLAAWMDAGLPTGVPAERQGADDFFAGVGGVPFPRCPHYDAQTAEVEAAVRGAGVGRTQLADVRSWREFSGGGHDYPFALPRGRIPGALWAHWGPSTYVGGDFFTTAAAGALLSYDCEQTAELWSAWGLEVGSESSCRVVFYCGSGWRSAVGWCLARLLGHSDCASYDGGFLEWAMLHERAAEHAVERDVSDVRPVVAPASSNASGWPACACPCRQDHPSFDQHRAAQAAASCT